MTWTASPFLIRSFAISEPLRSQRNYLHELLVAQLATDGPEDAGPARVAVVAQDDGRVLVEADVRAVGAAALLDGADDDGLDHVALLDVAAGDRVLDGGDDDVADAGVATARAAEHADAENLLGTRVVGDT